MAVMRAAKRPARGRPSAFEAENGSVFGNDRAAEAVVEPHRGQIDILLDAVGAGERDRGRREVDVAGAHEQVVVFSSDRPVRGKPDLNAGTDGAAPTALAGRVEQPAGRDRTAAHR